MAAGAACGIAGAGRDEHLKKFDPPFAGPPFPVRPLPRRLTEAERKDRKNIFQPCLLTR
jgi:hypothetical protein